MKKLITYIIPILLLLIVSCAKTPKERVLTMKDVFPTQKNTDSTVVFDLDTVKNFESLTSVFCSNYYNKGIRYFIRTSKNDIPFSIRSSIVCGKVACGLIKFRNILFIDYYTDILFYHNRIKHNFNTVHFGEMLRKQFFNNRNNSEFADNPKASLILLEFSGDLNDSKIRLKNKVDIISKSYYNFITSFKKQNIDSLKRLYPLKIRLNEAIPFVDEKGNNIEYNPAGPEDNL